MGRRRRKTYTELEQDTQPVSVEECLEWPTAIYARLSVENSGKDDKGESIEGQVELCRDYVEEHPYLHLYDTYIDNGWTGTNTDRPAFQRLLKDIEKRKVRALVIKDFSRFSRDYIEAGNLLENLSFRKNQKGQEWKLHEKCSYDFMRQSRGSSAAAG